MDRRRAVTLPIAEGLLCLRCLSPQRLRFEVEYGLERGTTANSFLIPGGEPLLIHPPGASFAGPFLAVLARHCGADERLRVVVGHVNPNRVGLLRQLAAAFPRLQLLASAAGAKLLRDLWDAPAASRPSETTREVIPPLPTLAVVRGGQRVPVGEAPHNGQLGLIPLPTPRWPDGLAAFDDRHGILFSGKFFAAHRCCEELEDRHRNPLDEDHRYYYDCLMAPMAQQVEAMVDRLEDLPIQAIAPGHGPVISESWRSLFNNYRRWGEGQRRAPRSVALLFASAYGNTAAMAAALAQGITKAGVRVQSINCEFSTSEELQQAIREASALVIGSPTLGGHAPTPIVAALGTVLTEADRSKPVGVFGSFGWSGEAIDLLEQKLKDGGFAFAFPTIRVRFSPDARAVKRCEETGTDLAQALRRKGRQQQRAAGGLMERGSTPSLQALGRVVGSLCILTVRRGEGEQQLSGAMVASWVSQASFSPPGISVAVAKDRAVEQLLHRGDCFALNVLAAGRERGLMKHFLQPFAAGADRFRGLATTASPQGQPLLAEALAWLEVKVAQRLECGDHWVIYGEVEAGDLLDEKGTTAVHQRRSGANY